VTNINPVVEGEPAQGVSFKGRLFSNQTFHFETLRNAGYVASNCADLGEILETVKVIAEGDVESWYSGWKATADRFAAVGWIARTNLAGYMNS
jgi:hypothetical protein